MQTTLLERAWSETRGAFTAGFGVEDLDASVLLLPEIGLIEPTIPASPAPSSRSRRTCCAAST